MHCWRSHPRPQKGARGGNRNGHNEITWNFARAGYVSATLSYRLVPKFIFPAQVQDVKAATRFLRGNAEKYNIDAKRLEIVGRGWEEPAGKDSAMNRRVEVQWFTLE